MHNKYKLITYSSKVIVLTLVWESEAFSIMKLRLEDVLNDDELSKVIEAHETGGRYECVRSDVRPATAGLAGFLGDHLRLTLHLRSQKTNEVTKLRLFVKALPVKNPPKAEFITEMKFFVREKLIFEFFEKIDDEDHFEWHPRVYLYSDRILVLEDLSLQGYSTRDRNEPFDPAHCVAALSSLARYHAACLRHHKTVKRILEEHPQVFDELSFVDCAWLRVGAKLTTSFLHSFSKKYTEANGYPYETLLIKMTEVFVQSCEGVRNCESATTNVLIHKDLWCNNIMFKYEDNHIANSMLIDFQCSRYAHPAFDVMIFMYLNTTRSFREAHETEMIRHYHEALLRAVGKETSKVFDDLPWEQFTAWVERARVFGLLVPVLICPYVLMDAASSERLLNDPATYELYNLVDRSAPVLGYARAQRCYRERLLEVFEEFVDRYLL